MAQDDTPYRKRQGVAALLRARQAALQTARKLTNSTYLRKGMVRVIVDPAAITTVVYDMAAAGDVVAQAAGGTGQARPEVEALATRVSAMVRLAAGAAPSSLVFDVLGEAAHVGLAQRLLDLVRRESAMAGDSAVVEDSAVVKDSAVVEGLRTGRRILDEAAAAAGGLLAPAALTKLFGISRATLHNRRRRRELLALPDDGARSFRYPARQFEPKIQPEMPRVLADGLDALGPDGMLVYLTQPQPTLGGRTAFDAISDGDANAVVAQLSAFAVPADAGAPLAHDAA